MGNNQSRFGEYDNYLESSMRRWRFDEAKEFVCDTRDFYIAFQRGIPEAKYAKLYRDITNESEEVYTTEEVLNCLEVLKERSGGHGQWRMIAFKDNMSDWYKYVRFIKFLPDKWFAFHQCTGTTHLELIRKSTFLTRELQDKELICCH